MPYEDTGVDKVGFFSGFKPVDAILPDPPSFFLRVNDTNPIFFYCGAPGSCIEHQMVGVINPNASTSLAQQKQDAKDSSFMLLPGEPWPSEANDPFTTTASTSTPTATSTSAPAATTSSSSHSHSHSSLSGGAIAGIVIGAAAVALGAAVALFLCGRHSRNQHNQHNQHATPFMQQQVPFQPPSHGHVSTYDPMKHMSMHSSVVGSALPGYVPVHNPHDSMATGSMPPTSPPLHPSFAPSDALGPGSDNRSETSPSQIAAVPAYTQSAVVNPHSPFGYAPSSGQPSPVVNAHEMPAAVPAQLGGAMHPTTQPQEGAGIMGFIRKSSVGKNGGVERYS